jgi:uncharacterized DUF497 family protein
MIAASGTKCNNALLLSVVFVEQQNQIIHLISVRQASPKEKEDYRENIRQIFGAQRPSASFTKTYR